MGLSRVLGGWSPGSGLPLDLLCDPNCPYLSLSFSIWKMGLPWPDPL